MAIIPDPTTTLTAFETALVEAEEAIITNSEAVDYSFYSSGARLVWTNFIRTLLPTKTAGELFEIPLAVEARVSYNAITEGLDGEAERAVRLAHHLMTIELVRNPRFKCTSYPSGVPGVEGVNFKIDDLAIFNDPTADAIRYLSVRFTVPIKYRIDIR